MIFNVKMFSRINFYLILFFIFFSPGYILSQDISDSSTIILKGTVISDENKPLPDVQVLLINESGEEFTDYSDIQGKFTFTLTTGRYDLYASIAGYDIYEHKNLRLDKQDSRDLEIILTRKEFTTEEINVEGQFRQRQDDLRTSVINITPKNVKLLPGAVEDVLRSLQTLPGVTSPNDFTSQLVIRGSGPDQNLIVMDDVEIFNPYRLYGLVSMFNPETLNDITLITGGFPAKYGDRLSAVLDVMNMEGSRGNNLNTVINTSVSNANLIFHGKNPLDIPGSWLVSSRRTYYDLIIGPIAKKAGLITEDSSFPSFKDLQFKIAFGPFKKNKFLASGIFSEDGVQIISGNESENPDSVAVRDVTKNDMLALAWHFIPDHNFISRTTLSWYRNSGDNEFESEIIDPLINTENYTPEQRDSLRMMGAILGLNFDSKYKFQKFALSNRSILYKGSTQYEFGGGLDLVRTDLNFNLNVDEQFKSIIRSFPWAQPLLEEFNLDGENTLRAHVYSQARYKLSDKIFFQPSLRLDYYDFLKKIYFSPRVNLGYAFDPLTTLRTAVGLYYQSPGMEKLVDNRTFFDYKSEKAKEITAERALHFVIGIDRWLNNEWLAKSEFYYKKFDNLLMQERLTGYRYEYYINDPSNPDPAYWRNVNNWIRSDEKLPYDSVTINPVNEGTGKAFGFEIGIEKKYMNPDTKFYGWVNYSLTFSDRTSYGLTRPYRFEQRHTANFVMNYRVNSWLELGARWTYASNFRLTKPIGITPRIVNDSIVTFPVINAVVFNLDFGGRENLLNEKKPDYHRLDIRATAYTNFWGVDWAFYLDVINAYNRKNVIGYDYWLDQNLEIKRKTLNMFPILPTIGVNARF
jgi:hypothetical protein